MRTDEQLPVAQPAKGANQGAQQTQRAHQHYQQWATGDGVKTRFALTKTPRDVTQIAVYVAGLRKRPAERGVAFDFSLVNGNGVVLFVAAPAAAANICFDVVST
jgi:hypothetical protein